MNGEHIRGIPECSRSSRLWIVLLKNLGDYALYFNKTGGFFSGFEVHQVRVKKAIEHDIKLKDGSVRHLSLPRRCVIASNTDFGRYAWHYPNIDLVYEKHPEFKKHSDEIESKLEDALISIEKHFLRVCIDKTSETDSSCSGGVE